MNITLSDLSAVVQIIDIASTRGAFKGAELSSVGGLRDKIAGALEEASKETAPEKYEVEEDAEDKAED